MYHIYVHTSTHSTCIIFIFYDPQEAKHLRQQFRGKAVSECCQTVTKSRGKLYHQLNNLNNRHYWARERGLCWSCCTLELFIMLCVIQGGICPKWWAYSLGKMGWAGGRGNSLPPSCSQVWPSSTQSPFLHNREVWQGYLKKMLAATDCHGWITVHWVSPHHCLLCQRDVWQRTGNANFVPSGDFLKTHFWLLQREQLSSHRVYTVQESLPEKIYYEHCRRKVHNKHNLSHSSQIHYWALTYEPTDL